MKKQYIKPIVMLIDTDILSNVMAASERGSGVANSEIGGGPNGSEHSGGGGMEDTGDDIVQGTKGSIFTWSDDDDNEYYD